MQHPASAPSGSHVSGAVAEPHSKVPKDKHPELSAPIVDLGLEARIARAEQAVIDRDARVRGDARAIVGTLRSKRGAVARGAAFAVGGIAAAAIGYGGYKAWSARKAARADDQRLAEPGTTTSFATHLAAIARTATLWALKLHREQGVLGSLFGLIRGALWPSPRDVPPPPTPGAAAGASSPAGGFDRSA